MLTRHETGITFSVDNVERATDPLRLSKTRDALTNLLNVVNVRAKKVEPVIYCSGYNSDCVAAGFNPLFATVHAAFSSHRPLVLSPDMIWTAILQGFAIHVHNNAEELRAMLVRHEGTETIRIEVDGIDPNSPESAWDEMIRMFSDKLSDRVGLAYNELVSRYSTTGEIERLVNQVTLMDVFEPYYRYEAVCICGIPEITLEGTPADWAMLRKQIDCLERYELDWWVPHLRRIADQFCDASNGNVDLEWWQNIYKLKKAYGGSVINGWFAKLIPYLRDGRTGKYTYRNPIMEEPDIVPDDPKDANPYGFNAKGFRSESIPSGLSAVPVSLICNDNKFPMQILAGFVGYDQNPDTLALRPRMGWAVRRLTTADDVLLELPKRAEAFPPQTAAEVERTLYTLCKEIAGPEAPLPDELISFYKRCNGIAHGDNLFLPLHRLELLPLVSTMPLTTEEARKAFSEQSANMRMLKLFMFDTGSYAALVLGRTSNNYVVVVRPDGRAFHTAESLNSFIADIFDEWNEASLGNFFA